jgi:hypothetical protein
MDPIGIGVAVVFVVILSAILISSIVGGKRRNKKAQDFAAQHPEAVKLYYVASKAGTITVNTISEGRGQDFHFGGDNRGLLLLPGPVSFKLTYMRSRRNFPVVVTGEFTVMARQGYVLWLQVDEQAGKMYLQEQPAQPVR